MRKIKGLVLFYYTKWMAKYCDILAMFLDKKVGYYMNLNSKIDSDYNLNKIEIIDCYIVNK